jgi:transcriptional regulator with XRE-family HTH domain
MSVYSAVKKRADGMNLAICEIEKRAKIANGTIGGWKTGRPYAETLQKVAKVLGCTIEDLLKGEENE